MEIIVFKKDKTWVRSEELPSQIFRANKKNCEPLVEDDSELIKQQQQEKLEQAEQSVSKQNTKKTKITNTVFFILNLVIVAGILVYQLTQETITPITLIENARLYLLPVAVFIFALIMFLDGYRTNIFLKESGNRSNPFLCYKMCAIGKYYDFITPMSVGGEPSQIFYMGHRGLDASSALSVPMARYVASQIAWMIMGILAVVIIIVNHVMDVSVVLVIGLVGFTLNFLLTSGSLLLSLSSRIGRTIVGGVLKFLQKIKIIKQYEKQYEKIMGVVDNYQSTMKTYAKNKWKFLYALGVSLALFALNYIMPFIIYLALGGTDYSLWLDMMVISVIIELGSSIIPLPGGTGMNELSFTFVFGQMFPEGTVFWGLLLWRGVTYYIYLLQGIGIITYDYLYGNKKFKWLQRKWELEAESISFKEEQIKKYKSMQKRNAKKKAQEQQE